MVQTTKEQQILKELSLLKLLPVEDRSVINNLSQQLDGLLGAVLINVGHVEIIDEANEYLVGC